MDKESAVMYSENEHIFAGKWISDDEFYALRPRNVFHKQLEIVDLDCSEHRNAHILFRKRFSLAAKPQKSEIYITADDYYKLYVNGEFVAQGPTAAYHFRYNYNVIDISRYLRAGENLIAVHTIYQGLINRVWQSADNRHGLLLDLVADGDTVLYSDESFKTARHTAYREVGTVGYQTMFLEEYDARSASVGFEKESYDDSTWQCAKGVLFEDHTVRKQPTKQLVFEKILPASQTLDGAVCRIDFGKMYAGCLSLAVKGKRGDIVTVRLGQELNDDGSVRYRLRANCDYEEPFILADGVSVLDQFDYRAFRYVELLLPDGCTVEEVSLCARHYPFAIVKNPKEKFKQNKDLMRIWELCVRTQEYGVQEAILDCMEREKGFYLGDGCYTALTHMILTGDDSIVRMLIDDAFASSFITDGLVTCMDCSFMQEIAEYPLMLISLILWHYRLVKDKAYLKRNYAQVVKLLEAYRRDYEKEYLLRDLDKWCVVEWPENFRDGYDVDIAEGKVCKDAHISINAYYIEAIRCANLMAEALGEMPYRAEAPLRQKFIETFYLPEEGFFRDGERTKHVSLIGNVFPFAFGLCPDENCRDRIYDMICRRKVSAMSFFCAFPMLEGAIRNGRKDDVEKHLLDEGAWLRMLREDATTTFEGWGRDTKWNTSLFHMTFSYAALFLADIDLETLFM